MKKRGQIQNRIFLFAAALIILAVIVIWGYKAISSMQEKQNQAALIKFKTQLAADVESAANDFGSRRSERYFLPTNFDEMCLVDTTRVDANDILNHPVVMDNVDNGAKANLFFLGKNEFEAFDVGNLGLAGFPHYWCVETKIGKIELTYEGKGGEAMVKMPVSERSCQHAQDETYCDRLDTIFGTGSRDECCNKYTKCC